MKKAVILVIVVLLLSSFALAEETEEEDYCKGFWGKVKCFLFGDPAKRPIAGGAWWERGSDCWGIKK